MWQASILIKRKKLIYLITYPLIAVTTETRCCPKNSLSWVRAPEQEWKTFSLVLLSKYLGQLGLLGEDVVRCPGDPLLEADVAVVANLTEHLGSENNSDF